MNHTSGHPDSEKEMDSLTTNLPTQDEKEGRLHDPHKHDSENEKCQKKCVEDFDDILDIVGSQGKFQKFLLYAVVCPITAIQPFLNLNILFMLFTPEHWCHVPGRDNETSLEQWKILTIPLDHSRLADSHGNPSYSQCNMFSNSSDVADGISKCKWGWEYDRTDYVSTLPGDFNWVCDQAQVPTNAFTASAMGNAVGTIIFGHIADKYGRKPIFFLTITINILFRVISLFSPENVLFFYMCQFLIGSAETVMFLAPSMISAEVCDKEYRAWVYSVTWMIWVIGMAALPFLAWICADWYLIGMLTSVPAITLLLYFRVLPESPRWLLSMGKAEKASEILYKIAQENNRAEETSVSELNGMLEKLIVKQKRENDGKNTGVWTLFSRKRLAMNTSLFSVSWSINFIVYAGITLNTTNMPGNQFINFFLLSIIELPSGWCGGILADKLGRRWLQVIFFLACMISCVGATIGADITLELSAVVLAKFAITLTFLVVYLQGAEIFPTQLRYTGIGFASTIGAIAGTFVPTIAHSSVHDPRYPYWIMGTFCLIGAIVSAFLPETLNQSLPETIDDANQFGKGVKFWSVFPKARSKSTGSTKLSTVGQDETAMTINSSIDPPQN